MSKLTHNTHCIRDCHHTYYRYGLCGFCEYYSTYPYFVQRLKNDLLLITQKMHVHGECCKHSRSAKFKKYRRAFKACEELNNMHQIYKLPDCQIHNIYVRVLHNLESTYNPENYRYHGKFCPDCYIAISDCCFSKK